MVNAMLELGTKAGEHRGEIETVLGGGRAPGSVLYKTPKLLLKRLVRCYQTEKLEEKNIQAERTNTKEENSY